MPRFKHYNYDQDTMVVINYQVRVTALPVGTWRLLLISRTQLPQDSCGTSIDWSKLARQDWTCSKLNWTRWTTKLNYGL